MVLGKFALGDELCVRRTPYREQIDECRGGLENVYGLSSDAICILSLLGSAKGLECEVLNVGLRGHIVYNGIIGRILGLVALQLVHELDSVIAIFRMSLMNFAI
jgi:hypothetical protein